MKFVYFVFAIGLSQCQDTWSPCDSLICDPPKRCIIKDEIAQCSIEREDIIKINLHSTPFSIATTEISTLSPLPSSSVLAQNKPSPADPFAEFLQQFSLPTLPPLQTTSPIVATPSPQPNVLPSMISVPIPPTTQEAKRNICILPPLTGQCSRARIMWYYDTETRACERFSYSGCGNLNRFESRSACEKHCIGQ